MLLSKRPTAEESHEHRWLLPTEYMIKKRERTMFLSNRLKEYNEQYRKEKLAAAMPPEKILELTGNTRQLIKSTSVQDELVITQ